VIEESRIGHPFLGRKSTATVSFLVLGRNLHRRRPADSDCVNKPEIMSPSNSNHFRYRAAEKTQSLKSHLLVLYCFNAATGK